MSLAISRVPTPVNEPVKGYAPGSPERASLKAKLEEMASQTVEMPLVIGGRDVRTGKTGKAVMPHRHAHVLGEFHQGGETEVKSAIDAALGAQKDWAALPWEARAAAMASSTSLAPALWNFASTLLCSCGQRASPNDPVRTSLPPITSGSSSVCEAISASVFLSSARSGDPGA